MSNYNRYEFLISEGLEEEFNENYFEAIKKYSEAITAIPSKTTGYYFRALIYFESLLFYDLISLSLFLNLLL